MSAIEISNKECKILAIRIVNLFLLEGYTETYRPQIKDEAIKKLAENLFVENQLSLNARYKDDIKKYEEIKIESLQEVSKEDLKKMLEFYDYQTCEHEEYFGSQIFCIIQLALSLLVNYKKSEIWGIK